MSTVNWYRIEAEEQTLSLETLRLIEQALEIEFGVDFDNLRVLAYLLKNNRLQPSPSSGSSQPHSDEPTHD